MIAAHLPRISLVTTNHNYGRFIGAAIESVVNQGYPNLEYIVLDHKSTDGSVDIIRRYESRLAYWESRDNPGHFQTITKGLQRATGEVFGWLNSDDMHLPWTLRAVGDIFATFPQVEWISSLRGAHWDWDGFCVALSANRGFSREAFLDGRYLPPQATDPQSVPPANREFIQQESTFWRRSLWEKAGGCLSQEFGSAGDFELFARFYGYAELIGVDVPLAGFRHQHQQKSAQRLEYASLCEPVLKELRTRLGWKPSPQRSLVHRARSLLRGEAVADFAFRPFAYTGQRIVRRDIEAPGARWVLEEHRFV
jgi:glycosyltransferase involved in cell wall biosynthesis